MTAGAVLAEASAIRAQIPTTTKSSLAAPAFAGVNGDGVTVTLSWYAVKGAIGYELLRAPDPQQKPVTISLPNTTLGYRDTHAGAGAVYYQLVAIDATGGRAASAWFAHVPPSVQSVSADGADVVVTWTGVQNAPGGYEVWRAASPNQRPTRVAAVSSSTRQHRDKQAAGGGSYYQIVAVGPGGSRASSAWIQANASAITNNPPPTGNSTVVKEQIAQRVEAAKKSQEDLANVLASVIALATAVVDAVIQLVQFAGGSASDTDRQLLTSGTLIAAAVAAIEVGVATVIGNLPTIMVEMAILDFQTQNVAAGDLQPNLLTRAQIDQVAAKIPPGDASTAGLTNELKKLVATLKPKD